MRRTVGRVIHARVEPGWVGVRGRAQVVSQVTGKSDLEEGWMLEAISLTRPEDPNLRVIIGIEADLLGFRIEERHYAAGRASQITRRFSSSLSRAVLVAGQLSHDLLRNGFRLDPGTGSRTDVWEEQARDQARS